MMADVSKAAWDYFTLVSNGGQPPAVDTPLPDPNQPVTPTLPFTQTTP
jgi:hypothetical protein